MPPKAKKPEFWGDALDGSFMCRCRLSATAAFHRWHLFGKWFAVSPNRAVLEMFLLPDRHRAFECINQPSASVKSSRAMRGSDSDEHAGFADFQAPQPMNDRSIANWKLRDGFPSKPLHLLISHLFIGFVIEIKRAPPSRLVADNALKHRHGTVLGMFYAGDDLLGVNHIAHDRNTRRAATYRRQ